MQLSDVRLTIPTYNRAAFVRRQLAYYNSFDLRLPITLADSSDEAIFHENAATILEFPQLSVTHDRISQDLNPHYKFGLARERVAEEFSIMCADDDFIFLPALIEGLAYLRAHPDYAQVHGSYIAFHTDETVRTFSWVPIYRHRTIASADPAARFLAHTGHYYNTLFALMRSADVQAAYRTMTERGVDPVLWGELLPSFLLPLFGKSKVLNTLWAIRDGKTTGRHTWPTSDQYRSDGKYDDAYALMRAAATPLIAERCGLPSEEAGALLDRGIGSYMQRLAKLQHEQPSTYARLIERIRVRLRKEFMRLRYRDVIEKIRAIVLE